jgi:hypothetical protein
MDDDDHRHDHPEQILGDEPSAGQRKPGEDQVHDGSDETKPPGPAAPRQQAPRERMAMMIVLADRRCCPVPTITVPPRDRTPATATVIFYAPAPLRKKSARGAHRPDHVGRVTRLRQHIENRMSEGAAPATCPRGGNAFHPLRRERDDEATVWILVRVLQPAVAFADPDPLPASRVLAAGAAASITGFNPGASPPPALIATRRTALGMMQLV